MGHRVLRWYKNDHSIFKYGLLYNAYSFLDARKLTSSDAWNVPSLLQMQILADYLGAAGDYQTNNVGGKLKIGGNTFWNEPNSGATNLFGFNGKGAGYRNYYTGAFTSINELHVIWSSTDYLGTNKRVGRLAFNNDYFACATNFSASDKTGYSIRFVADATGVPDGTLIPYIGNDLKEYMAVAINGLYWLKENLAETKYRTGDLIPEVTDNNAWKALDSGALCAYNNDWNYV